MFHGPRNLELLYFTEGETLTYSAPLRLCAKPSLHLCTLASLREIMKSKAPPTSTTSPSRQSPYGTPIPDLA